MSSLPPSQLAVVGSINADLVVRVERHPAPGETVLATASAGHELLAGGKGANQAVAAALLGADVAFVGAVGSDAYAEPALKHLLRSGVDLGAVAHLDDCATGLAIITVAADGENTIVVSPGANARVDAAFVSAHSAAFSEAGIVLLQGEIPASGVAAAVRAATGRVVINLAPVIEVPAETLLAADPIVANEHEAGLILAQLRAEIASTDPRDVIAALIDAGFASAIITLGARGALVASGGEIADIPTPKVTPVDTTGAGDAFVGALCAQLLSGAGLVKAARFAARVGAHATLGLGAQGSYPNAETALPSTPPTRD